MVEAAALQNGILKAREGSFLRFCSDKQSSLKAILKKKKKKKVIRADEEH